MTTINYIVTCKDTLHHHMQHVYTMLKRNNEGDCLIKQITISYQDSANPNKDLNKYLWEFVFNREFPDVKLVYTDEYTTWLQCSRAYSNYDYHLFIQDDFRNSIDISAIVDLYRKSKIPDNIGYLTDSAMANGLASKRTIQTWFTPTCIVSDIFTRIKLPSNSDVKKIAFYINQFSIRGSEIAIYEYACYNEVILGNKSIFIIPSNHKQRRHPISGLTHVESVESKFTNTFPVVKFDNTIQGMNSLLKQEGCDALYYLKYGTDDGIISHTTPTIAHSVFICEESHKHGDVYACISADINKCNAPIVPHICLPMVKSTKNLRKLFSIPESAIVFGRYGGIETFDLDFVHETIKRVLNVNPNVYFLFMNTTKFYNHPRIIYSNKQTDIISKSMFINACDAMLHARKEGETFGLAIAEFTSLGKPIICWNHDGPLHDHEFHHHISTLGETGIYYRNEEELFNILNTFDSNNTQPSVDYTKIFSPEKVMKLFDEKLLQPIFAMTQPSNEAPQPSEKPYYSIKILCNWSSSADIHRKWTKMIGNYPIKFVDDNPDYWVIINKPPDGSVYDPSRTIVMGMEPDTFTGDRWNWYGDKSQYLYFLDENFLNNIEWWLDLTHTELSTSHPTKTKGNIISSIVSSQYSYPGHKLRIDFLKEAENDLKFDIFGWDNNFNFKSYVGSLPSGKDDGLLPYKYTFACENTKRKNYFTEKLSDSILSECLCFYWGCPNIPDYLDDRCFIQLDIEDIEGSIRLIRNTIRNNTWEKRLSIIRAAKNLILTKYAFIPRITGLIKLHSLKKKVINLDHRPEKFADYTKNQHVAQLSNVERFSAIEGKNYDMNSDYIKNTFIMTQNFVGPNKNTNAIVGCALSHYTLWQETVASNSPMLVMEDDVVFEDRFIDRMAGLLIDQSDVMDEQKAEYDIIFIGFHQHEDNCDAHGLKHTHMADTFGPNDIVSFEYMRRYGTPSDASGLHGGGTFGYLLTVNGAKKLVNMVHTSKIYFPVDYQILECGLHYGLNIGVCPHQLVTSAKFGIDTMVSDIQVSATDV